MLPAKKRIHSAPFSFDKTAFNPYISQKPGYEDKSKMEFRVRRISVCIKRYLKE